MLINNHYKGFSYDYQKKICKHLDYSNIQGDVYQYFTGQELQFYLICQNCASNLNNIETKLVLAEEDHFEELAEYFNNIVGSPQVLEKIDESIKITHETIDFEDIIQSKKYVFRAFYPMKTENTCFLLLENKLLGRLDERIYLEIVKFDFTNLQIISRLKLSDIGRVDLNKQVTLILSPDYQYFCIFNTFNQYGVILDKKKRVLLLLDRGNYYAEQTEFPVGFIIKEGNTLVIHGTDWNRLDIFDLTLNKSLSDRDQVDYKEDKYLDFFHGKLSISPSYTWLVDDGWVWAPVGVTLFLKIDDWLENNPWASEDAETLFHSEIWGRNIIWIDENKLIVWGYSSDDSVIDGVTVWDLQINEEVGWFPGPYNQLLYDSDEKLLFSSEKDEGMSIWDIDTGELLKTEAGLIPHFYIKASKSFVTHLENSKFKISKIIR